MERTIGHLGTKIQVIFADLDEEGNSRQEFPLEMQLRSLAPSAWLEACEQVHSQRNALRAKQGLPEVGLPLQVAEAKKLLAEPASEAVARQMAASRNGAAKE